jgi:hypothetical protein
MLGLLNDDAERSRMVLVNSTGRYWSADAA